MGGCKGKCGPWGTLWTRKTTGRTSGTVQLAPERQVSVTVRLTLCTPRRRWVMQKGIWVRVHRNALLFQQLFCRSKGISNPNAQQSKLNGTIKSSLRAEGPCGPLPPATAETPRTEVPHRVASSLSSSPAVLSVFHSSSGCLGAPASTSQVLGFQCVPPRSHPVALRVITCVFCQWSGSKTLVLSLISSCSSRVRVSLDSLGWPQTHRYSPASAYYLAYTFVSFQPFTII